MTGVVDRDSGPVCASCAQPVDPRGFVCLNCGATLQDAVSTLLLPAGPPAPPPPPPPAFSSPQPPPPPPPPPMPAPAWERPAQGPTGSGADQMPTQVVPRLPAAPAVVPEAAAPPPPPPIAPVPADPEADERTVVVARRPKAEWGLRLGSGELVPVDAPLLLGRNPVASAGPDGAGRVTIDDPGRTVSRSHLVVLPEPGEGIVLRDLSSANGIVLVAPDGAETEIEPGGEVRIAERCTVLLGSYEIGIEPLQAP